MLQIFLIIFDSSSNHFSIGADSTNNRVSKALHGFKMNVVFDNYRNYTLAFACKYLDSTLILNPLSLCFGLASDSDSWASVFWFVTTLSTK